MSKRRRLTDEQEEGGTSTKNVSWYGRLPSALSMMVKEFGEYEPSQQRVSQAWRSEATRYCERQTKQGETCLRKGGLVPSCVRYCTSPAPCLVWFTRLLTAMERASNATIENAKAAIVANSTSVVVSYGRYYSLRVWLHGGRWKMRKNSRLFPPASVRVNEALGYPHFLLELSPTVQLRAEETDAEYGDAEEEFRPDEDRSWSFDAPGAAQIICRVASGQEAKQLSLQFIVDVRLQDEAEGPVSFADADGNAVTVADPDQEWWLYHTALRASISLEDTHALWCRKATVFGSHCVGKGNRLHQGCADYCVGSSSPDSDTCRAWVDFLLGSLGSATGLQALVVVPGHPGRSVPILTTSASVDLLDGENQSRMHLQYLHPQWTVDAATPGVEAWRERMLRLRLDNNELPLVSEQVVLHSGHQRTSLYMVDRLLCHGLRDPSIKTLRAEIAYVLPDAARRLKQAKVLASLGTVSGSQIAFPRDAYDNPVELRYDWEITPHALRADLHLGPMVTTRSGPGSA